MSFGSTRLSSSVVCCCDSVLGRFEDCGVPLHQALDIGRLFA